MHMTRRDDGGSPMSEPTAAGSGAEAGSGGWIGTGRMGAAMATRLARAGADLAVWNRTRAKAEPLAEHGAQVVDAIADLRGRDVVFTMVSSDKDLEQVLTGARGLIAEPGSVPKV